MSETGMTTTSSFMSTPMAPSLDQGETQRRRSTMTASWEPRIRAAVGTYVATVAIGALLTPLLAFVAREAGSLRNWQYLGLALGLAVLCLDPLQARLGPLVKRALRPQVLLSALGVWMLAGETLNFLSLHINGIDFSVFDLMLEQTLQGKFMYSPVYRVNHFGIHQTWWLLPLVPLHALWRGPGLLVVTNVCILWIAGVLLYRLVSRERPLLASLALIAYATNPWTARLLRDGFRPESFYPLCIFGLAGATIARRPRSAILWAIALCLVKEDASLYFLAFAIAVAVGRTFSVPVAAVLALAAVSVLAIDLKIVQPWQLGSRPPGYVSFWSGYGASLGEILGGALRH